MDDFLSSLSQALQQVTNDLPYTLSLIGLLVFIHIVNALLGYRLNMLGIWPRKKWGWIGIPFSPFLHGNFRHLFFNAFPLFIFANFVLLSGEKKFFAVTGIIILLGGFLVWIFGRRGVHIGASTLIMGYLGFITMGIYHDPTPLSLLIGAVCLLYFGGLFLNLLPSKDKRVSWEGHVLGFIAGIIASYWLSFAY